MATANTAIRYVAFKAAKTNNSVLERQSADITREATEMGLSLVEEETWEDIGRNADLYVSSQIDIQD